MKPLTLASPRWLSALSQREAGTRVETVGGAFLISIALHLSAVLIGMVYFHEHRGHRPELLSVQLINTPRQETAAIEKTEVPPPKQDKPKASPASAPAKEEPTKTAEAKPIPPERMEPPSFASRSPTEGAGSPAGTEHLFGTGDVGGAPGSGNPDGVSTAASGFGLGSGAPGLPAESVLRTNREAKPIKTARANYPSMALRAGLESDVTLRVIVDTHGNVAHAEITKGGGAAFDEEALKAVKQSRFQPAQNNGQNVLAEFSYVFRFRMQR